MNRQHVECFSKLSKWQFSSAKNPKQNYLSFQLCILLLHFLVAKMKSHIHKRKIGKAQFKRRTFHVPNLMQMSENNRFFSFALDSAHVKFDVWTGPKGNFRRYQRTRDFRLRFFRIVSNFALLAGFLEKRISIALFGQAMWFCETEIILVRFSSLCLYLFHRVYIHGVSRTASEGCIINFYPAPAF